MMMFFRIACYLLVLIIAAPTWAMEDPLVASERQVQESYDMAVKIVQAQKPSLLMDLEKEQKDWRDFRDAYCSKAKGEEYCKANMNRKRARVLLGQHPSGKESGKSF